jgi:hypothetical protein
MLTLLILIPWVLTVAGLLFIMFMKKNDSDDHENDHDDLFENEEVIRVAVFDERAYWVYDNVFYESDVTREPDFTTARPIDTMDLAPKELNKLMHILDELQEETERD